MSVSIETPKSLRAFVAHLNSLQPGCAEFQNLAPPASETPMPEPLREWIASNGGPFSFSFTFQGEQEYSGALEVDPAAFEEHRSECRSWAEETWIADDPEEKEKWLQAFPFAALANGDYLALEHGGNEAGVIYLSHDDTSQALAPSLGEFVRTWERLCYIGPEIWVLEDFIDSQTLDLNADSEEARELREEFRLSEAGGGEKD
jgi:hypothetical protein